MQTQREKAAAGGLYLYSGSGSSPKPIARGTEFKFFWSSCQGSAEGYIMAETNSKMVKICRYVLVGLCPPSRLEGRVRVCFGNGLPVLAVPLGYIAGPRTRCTENKKGVGRKEEENTSPASRTFPAPVFPQPLLLGPAASSGT